MVRLYRARVSSGGGCPVREGDFGKRRVPGGHLQQYLRVIVGAGGSLAEWLACRTQAQKGPGSNRSRDAVG